jgi:tetratricopeptide (TPR) repeat protein
MALKIVGLFLGMVFFGISTAQQLDSLRAIYHSANSNAELAKLEVALAELYLNRNSDSAKYLAKKAQTFSALRAEDVFRSYLVLAKVAVGQDSLQLSRTYLYKGERFKNEVSDTSIVLNYLMIRAYVSELNADYDDAVDQNQKGLSLALGKHDTAYLSRFHNNLGLAYKAIHFPEDAIEQLRLAAFFFHHRGEDIYESTTWLNIAACFVDLVKYDSALFYLDRAHNLFQEKNRIYELIVTMGNYAEISLKKKEFEKAIVQLHTKLSYIQQAEVEARPVIQYRCSAYQGLGDAYLALRQTDSAMYYYRAESRLAQSQNMLQNFADASLGVSRAFEQVQNTDSAFAHFKTYVMLRDSLTKIENTETASRLKADFEFKLNLEIEKQKLSEAKARTTRLTFIYLIVILSLVVVLMMVVLAYQRVVKKRQKEELAKLTLTAEKNRIEIELLSKQSELTAKHVELSENQQRLDATIVGLKEVIADSTLDSHQVMNNLIRQMEGKGEKHALSSLDDYLKSSDTRFFEALSRKHKSLTRSDLRLCAFVRLNLTTKEIASITHQNAASIKVARYRLRKKLGLDKNASLTGYLNEFVGENA